MEKIGKGKSCLVRDHHHDHSTNAPVVGYMNSDFLRKSLSSKIHNKVSEKF